MNGKLCRGSHARADGLAGLEALLLILTLSVTVRIGMSSVGAKSSGAKVKFRWPVHSPCLLLTEP